MTMRRVLLPITVLLIVFILASEVYAGGLVIGPRRYYPGFSRFHYPRYYYPRSRSLFITRFNFDVPLFYPAYRVYGVPAFDRVERTCTRQVPGRFEYREVAPSFYEKVWVEGRTETYDCSYYVPRDP